MTDAELSTAWADWEDTLLAHAWDNRPWWQRWIMGVVELAGTVQRKEWEGW